MPLKQSAKKDFTAGPEKSGSAVHIKSPRIKCTDLSDTEERAMALMIYGAQGTGKTFIICDLLELDYKILVLSTDFGGSGLSTVVMEMKRRNKKELLGNVKNVTAKGYQAVRDFIDHPEKYVPGLWETFVPDIIFWDGFSGFQQLDIAEHIEDSGKGDDSDLKFEMAQWGMVRNATIRTSDDFLKLTGPNSTPHKVLTCLEKTIVKEGVAEDCMSPLLQGAGGVLILAAFDAVWRLTAARTGTGATLKTKRTFETQPDGSKRVAKTRGFDIEPVVDANMYHLWPRMLTDLDLPIPECYTPKKEVVNG